MSARRRAGVAVERFLSGFPYGSALRTFHANIGHIAVVPPAVGTSARALLRTLVALPVGIA
ncbi:hypothetical protein [Paenibacillus sp. sgz500958]|uniref:hypothetical protein n=1 Tax=Paenibacillus sp. sgz500958 TaxID=3242475 RepID=UPI0036D30E03